MSEIKPNDLYITQKGTLCFCVKKDAKYLYSYEAGSSIERNCRKVKKGKSLDELLERLNKKDSTSIQIENSILDRAIEMWGKDAQIKMCREECLELALAIGKYYERDVTNFSSMVDEMADVTIMIRQMERIPELKDLIQERVNFKMERLNERLNKKQF